MATGQRNGSQVATDEDGPPHPADVAEREQPQQVAVMPSVLGDPQTYGQATRVQMAAAIAEVQAMVVVAKAHRRNMSTVLDDVLAACDQPFMAEQAFYEYNRGDGRIKGITVQLARELLRCFGNAQSGIIELQRLGPTGTEPGRSEMQAWAWDMQTNTRMSTTFWATHTRDRSKAKGGPQVLEAERDIYENNANMGSRRERAMIERILPAYLVEMAKERCMATLKGDAKTLPDRIERCVTLFADNLGVPVEVLEARVGRPRLVWGGPDLANLLVVYRSLERGETTLAEAFADQTPAAHGADAALAKATGKTAPADGGGGDPGPPDAGPAATTTAEPGTAPSPAGDQPDPAAEADRQRTASLTAIRAGFRQAKLAEKPQAELRRLVVAALAAEENGGPPVPVKNATDLDAEQAARVAQRLAAILDDTTRNPTVVLEQLAADTTQRLAGE